MACSMLLDFVSITKDFILYLIGTNTSWTASYRAVDLCSRFALSIRCTNSFEWNFSKLSIIAPDATEFTLSGSTSQSNIFI